MLKRIAQSQFLRTTGFRVGLVIATIVILIGAVAILARPASSANADPFAPFEPETFGIPEVVTGYRIVLVRTAGNTACIPDGSLFITIQPVDPLPRNPLAGVNTGDIQGELQNLKPDFEIQLEYVGSAPFDRQQFLEQNQEWNLINKDGCMTTGGPFIISTPEANPTPDA